MSVLIRDSTFGRFVRIASNNRLFQYRDEVDRTLVSEKCPDDPNVIDWYGPDDPDNPCKWSNFVKYFVCFQVSLLTFSVYVGSAIYTAGIESVIEDFHTTDTIARLGITFFVLGYGIGPMLWSPLSEVPSVGRTTIYISTLFAFILLNIPTGLAVNLPMLFVFRFLTGVIGSPSIAMGGATMADIFTAKERSIAIALWDISAVAGPGFGPLLAGYLAQYKGWRWTIWLLNCICAFTITLLFFFLPETSAPNVLYRRARRLRKLTGDQNLICTHETGPDANTIDTTMLIRAFTLNFQEPVVLVLNTYTALIYALLYVFFESFPYVFQGVYGFTAGQESFTFFAIFVGDALATAGLLYWIYTYAAPHFNSEGDIEPEMRLPPAFVAAIVLPISLFWFGWSARPDVTWVLPIVAIGVFSVGQALMFNAALNYLTDAYPNYAASVLAGNGWMRSVFGATFPLFATAMYENLGAGWASSLLGFLALLFAPAPFLFYKYGSRIRRASSRARHDF